MVIKEYVAGDFSHGGSQVLVHTLALVRVHTFALVRVHTFALVRVSRTIQGNANRSGRFGFLDDLFYNVDGIKISKMWFVRHEPWQES